MYGEGVPSSQPLNPSLPMSLLPHTPVAVLSPLGYLFGVVVSVEHLEVKIDLYSLTDADSRMFPVGKVERTIHLPLAVLSCDAAQWAIAEGKRRAHGTEYGV